MSVSRTSGSASALPPDAHGDGAAAATAASSAGGSTEPRAERGGAAGGRMAALASIDPHAGEARHGDAGPPSLDGIAAPTPEQFADAWVAAFAETVRDAAGSDGRITRAEARRIAEQGGAGWLAADNLTGFLAASGQQSVSPERFLALARDFIVREATQVAGPNRRISLAEAARLPTDLRADFLYLRGRGVPPHRSKAELAAQVEPLVLAAFRSWTLTRLALPPREVRGERPLIESLRHPTDPSTRAIVYAADDRLYVSIGRSGTAQPGTPGVGWYLLGPVPPPR